jgi:hypothetical protein
MENIKKYFEMTCNIAGIRLTPRDADLFTALYDAVQKKGGDLSIKEITKIIDDVNKANQSEDSGRPA